MTIEHEQLISAREQLTRKADLYAITRRRRLNMRYDFKRRPTEPVEVALSARLKRIAWRTRPWRTVSEAEMTRIRVEAWSRGRARVFKTMDDYRDWEAYSEAAAALADAFQAIGLRAPPVQQDNAAGVLHRALLQAGRGGHWGLTFPRGLTLLATSLTDAGIKTTKDDLTYAARRKTPLVPHCVALVPETLDLLRIILRLFPTFEWRSAFRRTDQEAIEIALAAPSSAPV